MARHPHEREERESQEVPAPWQPTDAEKAVLGVLAEFDASLVAPHLGDAPGAKLGAFLAELLRRSGGV